MTTAAINSATVNFAKDRSGAGIYSAWTPERSDLNLTPASLEAVNMRTLSSPTSIEREGFSLAHHPIEGDWNDTSWLNAVYVPSCLDLVAKLTGARATLNMYYPIARQSDGTAGVAGPATFIHFDQPREEYAVQARRKAAEHGHIMGRAAMFNVWKATTPPPQNLPLGLCDRRAISVEDHVRGVVVEGGVEAPYIGLTVPSQPPKIYYTPDMAIGESLVFIAADFDPSNPLGCPHTAIAPPEAGHDLVPRNSVELRVLALFD